MGLKIEAEKITLNQWFEQWMSLYMNTRLKKTTISNYLNSYLEKAVTLRILFFNPCKDNSNACKLLKNKEILI